ncbi:MAG TPA: hypothetical protein VHT21_01065, partial [Stellaceae bacterium]|nr:hypothetical protein [Stellaceae bacterium]
VTEPAWLDGLLHRDAPILSKLPGFPARDGHRLAFSAHGKVPATAMASAFPLLFSPLARPHGHGSIAARKRPAGFLHKVAIASILHDFPALLHLQEFEQLFGHIEPRMARRLTV